jgi:integrase
MLNDQMTHAASRADLGGLIAEALEIRKQLEDPAVVARIEDDEGRSEEWTTRDFADEIIEPFLRDARRKGFANTELLANVALGTATPLGPLVEQWVGEQDIERRSKDDHRRAAKELIEWASDAKLTPTVEAFNRKAAGRYVSSLLTRLKDRGTVGKRLWSLSSMWRWLVAKGYAEDNPWRGQGVGQGGRSERDKEPERAFSDTELATLLSGTTDRTLLDLMRLAALSGMRLEEMALLEVRDVDPNAGTMTIREDPKTPAARRTVPIHTAVLGMMLARLKGKPADAFVFEELGPAPKEGRERSMPISKRFGHYRRSVGVHEKREGQRRSLVNFHSFRRWFITKAEQAGQPEPTIRAIVGHRREGITLGVYSSGPSLEQRRTCVEAVRLPDLASCHSASQGVPKELRSRRTERGGQNS